MKMRKDPGLLYPTAFTLTRSVYWPNPLGTEKTVDSHRRQAASTNSQRQSVICIIISAPAFWGNQQC